MFEIIKSSTKIDFASKFTLCFIVSAILVVTSLALTLTRMNYGVDFSGGAEIQAKFDSKVDLGSLRSSLEKSGFKSVSVQTIGDVDDHELLIRVPGSEANLNQISQQMSETLTSKFSSDGVQIRKVDIVGPKAGAQLRLSGFQAMGWAMLAIMIYVGLRFDFKYAPGAIVALIHDVSIVLGIYTILGVEFTLQTVAALLAVIGYSVNDTVIVYDRVREHEEKFPGVSMRDHINLATNETLSRTILTSGTTLFVSVAMLIFGGAAIADFFLAMTIGIVVGTYSSIFIAAPVTLTLEKIKKKKKNVGSMPIEASSK